MEARLLQRLDKQQQKTRKWARGKKVTFPPYKKTKEQQEEERIRGIFLENLYNFANTIK